MSSEFDQIFATLRALYAEYANKCVILQNDARRYHLGSREVRSTDGYRTAFGGVEINKSYVSAHLMPVYIHPRLLEPVSPDLRKRMQGKSCFNFRKTDKRLFDELDKLIRAGALQFERDGRLWIGSG